MKVFENIDNYDPSSVINLSEEDDERFIADLRRVITDLMPLRFNRRQTRQYFDKYLSIDRHITNLKDINEYFYGDGVAVGEYVPIEGEVRWLSRYFHPALLYVIESDWNSFGYLHNLLTKSVVKNKYLSDVDDNPIPDDIIQFYHKYGVEEVRLKLANMKPGTESLLFLSQMKTDCAIETEEMGPDWRAYALGLQNRLEILYNGESERVELLNKKAIEENRYIVLGPSVEEQKKSCVIANDYELHPGLFEDAIADCLKNIYKGKDADLNEESYDKAVGIIQDDFLTFVSTTFKTEKQQTELWIEKVEWWRLNLKSVLEKSFTKCQECVINYKEVDEGIVLDSVQRCSTLKVVKLLVEEANLIADSYIAERMYASREGREIMFVAWGGGIIALVERRKRLAADFGNVEEREECTDVDKNYRIFYQRMVEIAKDAFSECSRKSDSSSYRYRLQETTTKLSGWLLKMLHSYMELAESDAEILHCPFYETIMWSYVASSCAQSVFLTIEKSCACNHEMRMHLDSEKFQDLNFNVMPEIKDSLKAAYLCTDDDPDLRAYENDLGFTLLNKDIKRIPSAEESSIIPMLMADTQWLISLFDSPGNQEFEEIENKAMAEAEAARLRSLREQAEQKGLEVVELSPGARIIRQKQPQIDSHSEGSFKSSESEIQEKSSETAEETNSQLYTKFRDKSLYPVVIEFIKSRIGEGWRVQELTYFQALYESGLTVPFLPSDIFEVFPILSKHPQQFSKYVGSEKMFTKKGKRGGENSHRIEIEEHKRELSELVNSVKNK